MWFSSTMTSALVGLRTLAPAADAAAGTVFSCADADADADAGADAGADADAGAVGLRASPLPGTGVLLAVAGEIVGPGAEPAGCAVQPEITAMAAVAAHKIRRANRCRGGGDRILLLTIGRPSARSTVPS